MRRNSRKPNRYKQISLSDKVIIYSSIAIAILSAILIGLIIYNKNLDKVIEDKSINMKQMADIVDTNKTSEENSESASSEIGKSVEEVKKLEKNEKEEQTSQNLIEENETNKSDNEKETSSTNKTDDVSNNKNNSSTVTEKNTTISKNTNVDTNIENNKVSEETSNKKETEAKKELSFTKPVDGEIINDYAKDNLIYSKTLEEWVTHLGIDIKAEKTAIVKSAESGVIKSIKNDPRYGLTVVIDHEDGYQTIYSNLLTAEFVVEGEKVEKDQTIGTVGNTAAFESAEEPHLHFEILKNSIQEDPNIYLK